MTVAAMRPYLLLIPFVLAGGLPAVGDELPKRKAGLWEIKMAVGGREMPMRNVQQCTDAETDNMMATGLGGAMGSDCAKPKISSSGDSVTVDATCKIGSKTMTTRAVFSGNFDSAYTIRVTPMAAGNTPPSSSEPEVTMEARWIGPCQQGQRPGDIILPGGIKLNVRSLAIGSAPATRP